MNPSHTNIQNKTRHLHPKRPLIVPTRAHVQAYTRMQQEVAADMPAVALPEETMISKVERPISKKNRAKVGTSTTTIHHRLGKTARRSDVLTRASKVADETSSRQPSRGIGSLLRKVTFGVAITIVIAATGYVSLDSWLTNRKIESQFAHASSIKTDNRQSDKKQSRQEQEGKDETVVSPAMLSSHTVPADHPRIISIEKIDVKARVMPMGTNPDNSLQAPLNIFDAGWYTGSSKPGQAGAMVVDAHSTGPTRQGLFGNLDVLAKGDIVTVESGAGKIYKYRVVAKETVSRKKVDMQKLMLPYGRAMEGVNLISCTGAWEQAAQTYDQRAIVYAERVQ